MNIVKKTYWTRERFSSSATDHQQTDQTYIRRGGVATKKCTRTPRSFRRSVGGGRGGERWRRSKNHLRSYIYAPEQRRRRVFRTSRWISHNGGSRVGRTDERVIEINGEQTKAMEQMFCFSVRNKSIGLRRQIKYANTYRLLLDVVDTGRNTYAIVPCETMRLTVSFILQTMLLCFVRCARAREREQTKSTHTHTHSLKVDVRLRRNQKTNDRVNGGRSIGGLWWKTILLRSRRLRLSRYRVWPEADRK